MSRVVVIGGTGHVGTYLLPALVERGHDVINGSRGQAKRYRHHVAWNAIEQVVVDRTVEENAGTFSSTVAARFASPRARATSQGEIQSRAAAEELISPKGGPRLFVSGP
jgi:uncharacterized protein YbjT (DUF2867 family)